MRLRIGQSRLRGDVSRYAQSFDLLEVRAEPGTLPRPGRLREWRARVPKEFVFSVRLPAAVAELRTDPESDTALRYALRAAEALQAEWLLLSTPAAVTPAARTHRRLSALGDGLGRSSLRLAWEPAGLWEPEAAERVARELGYHLVCDLLRGKPPAGDTLYTRLRGLGGARFGVGAAERLAETVAQRREAYVVVEASGARRGASALRSAVAEIAAVDTDAFAFDETDD